MSRRVVYQNRFVAPGYRGTKETIFVTDEFEVRRWIQYFLNLRWSARTDADLTDNQRKEITAACEAFEWRADRPLLVKEPVR